MVGEEGAQGISINSEYKFLHQFMIQQVDEGMVLCLCSKNAEQDVMEVFEQREDMLLSLDNVVAHKINWDSKSDNIKTMAQELNLGLDSFIFIDDNPVECAEVAAACQGVLTFTLPTDATQIPKFLKNIWAFDRLSVTVEDKKRTQMYKQNIKREHLMQESLTLKDFIESLNLKITISNTITKNLSRVSQLTQRTNQFNLTSIRRSESEIIQLLDEGTLQALTVRVEDRFGDYGLVGVVLYKVNNDDLEIDTLLLSCRVLGKGVPHKMISSLGEKAYSLKLGNVLLPYAPTNKNLPALKFLESIAAGYKEELEEGYRFRLPTNIARKIVFKPETSQKLTKPSIKSNTPTSTIIDNQILSRIADELYSPELILWQINSSEKSSPSIKEETTLHVAPNNEAEKSIAEVWCKVLGTQSVGVYDNFFEIGGTSLKGVQLISLIRTAFNVKMSIVDLFENPTISSMAKTINPGSINVNELTQHKAKRRRRIVKRGAMRK